ncbi:hypothetical protein [Kitasatospora sp. NBC_01266]|uniref:hypothetical protein n=1 Tax=Kitasatospora sp. NBC_01266 TaxID=2903572 RepID=UPI002E30AA75|nr:hypothetical protein [Kitasatospora sp. NBC_01266]
MIGYAESAVQGYLERDSESVRILERKYHQLQVGALSEADSLDMIRAAWEALV